MLLPAGTRAADGVVRVGGAQLQHLRDIQSYAVGDTLRVGEIGGCVGVGTVLAMDAHEAIIRLEQAGTPPPAALPCTLVIGLPRPKMLKRILVDASSLGVKRICFINSYRVDKSFWSSPQLAASAIEEKCRLGLEQAIDTVLPVVTLHPRFRPFVEDELPALIGDSEALVAHPAGAQPCPQHTTKPTTLVIGPEGGFIPFEIESLQKAGCTPVTLGARILRVDTAVPALIGRLFG